jgi:hypothetical protein
MPYQHFELTITSLYGALAPSSTVSSPAARRDSAFEHASYENAALSPYSQKHFSPTTASPKGQGRQDRASTQVLPERIRSGDDVRTTVMIRNIPNKVDARMFKEILDASVRGKYDFSYLRIDFQNLCNVGYAFVNFTQAENILLLHDTIAGKRWNVYNSDKVAEMCYATIQGLDCCIDKFRNSSVMLEWVPHRPKLWYTDNDGPEKCGMEKEFPLPTNYQKVSLPHIFSVQVLYTN